jgi:transcription antitermination factor NusG
MFKIPLRFKTIPAVDKLRDMFWYVAHVGVPKNLLVIERKLKKCDFPEYMLWVPVYQEYARLRNHMLLVDMLTYPGYAFVGLQNKSDVISLRAQLSAESEDICGILGEGTDSITDNELRQVINVCSNYNSYATPLSSVKAGDHVIIAYGPLSGIPAEVTEVRQNGKVSLLAFFLNREIKVETTIMDITCSED